MSVPETTGPGRIVVEVPVIDHATDPVQSDTPADDPLALAAAWLPGEGEDRMLMTLATVDAEGFPRTRTVMLSEFDGEQFFFHTDAASRKVADLAGCARVGLTILWPGFTHQIVVQGTASPVSAAAAAEVYARRSPYLQQLAWMNTPEYARLPRARREALWSESAASTPPSPPPGWVGYGVRPHRLSFWTSHPAAASRRVEYTRGGRGWHRAYLPG